MIGRDEEPGTEQLSFPFINNHVLHNMLNPQTTHLALDVPKARVWWMDVVPRKASFCRICTDLSIGKKIEARLLHNLLFGPCSYLTSVYRLM